MPFVSAFGCVTDDKRIGGDCGLQAIVNGDLIDVNGFVEAVKNPHVRASVVSKSRFALRIGVPPPNFCLAIYSIAQKDLLRTAYGRTRVSSLFTVLELSRF